MFSPLPYREQLNYMENMPDLITVFVFPLIVAVFALIIEYWVIQPFKNREKTKENTYADPDKKPSLLTKVATNSFLLLGVVAFLLAIYIFLGGFRVSEISIAGIPIKILPQPMFTDSFLLDANISFAAILYASLTLNTLSFRLKNLFWFRIFTFFILPSALFFLWASKFTQELVYLMCLALVNVWLVVMSVVLSHRSDVDQYKGSEYISVFRRKSFSSALTFFLFLLPTNALILIFIVHKDTLVAWQISIMILTMSFFLYSTMKIMMKDRLEYWFRSFYEE